MRPQYSITTPPASEPISTDKAAEHVRVDSADDIEYLAALITVAREYAEAVTGRTALTTAHRVVAPSWAAFGIASDQSISLFRTPLVSVQAVKYYAPDAATITTMDTGDYRAITTTEPGILQITGDLPAVDCRPDAIQIEFTSGVATSALVPATMRHAIKMLVAHYYEQRVPIAFATSTEIPFGLRVLLEHQKIGGWSA